MPFNNQNTTEKLLPVQPNGMPPLNYMDVEAPPSRKVKNAFDVIDEVINADKLHELTAILNKYMSGKANLDNRIIENEQWWKLRHWEIIRREQEGKKEIEPTSGYLLNCVIHKHADAMDNFPTPNILPREESDKKEAEMLSSIIPVILEQDNFEQTYSDYWDSKLKNGTGVIGVFWDKSKHNGLGDISIKEIDLLNLYWEPGINDIQKSKYVFLTALENNDVLESKYPELEGKLGGKAIHQAEYQHDDSIDTTDMSVVIDCYYKVVVEDSVYLHYVKYVGDTVLFATENEPEYKDKGLYDHGEYPFHFDTLFKEKGTPTGFGYLDIGKSCQEYIDRMDRSFIENVEANAKVRAIIADSAGINAEEFADLSNTIIHATGRLNDDTFQFIKPPSLDSASLTVKNNKVEELKEVTGNRDVSTGGTTAGATAASAIAAMQEAGSKPSRDMIKSSYRTYRGVIVHVIELIRQFYDTRRKFRILGSDAGKYEFVTYSNKNIVPQSQGGIEFGVEMGHKIPVFDVYVTAEKQSPYSKMAQNELALQLYNAGFFNPQMTDQSLACIKIMDFDSKDAVIQEISKNGTLNQQLIARTQQALYLAQRVDMYEGTNLAEQIAAEINGTPAPPFPSRDIANSVDENTQLGGENTSESEVTKKARQRVAEATSPT